MAKELREIQIPAQDLELGMRVTNLDRPWIESPFLMQGFVVQTQDELDSLQLECQYVFIELTQENASKVMQLKSSGSRGAKGSEWKKHVGKTQYLTKISFEKEFETAKKEFIEARHFAVSIMEDMRIGKTLDMNKAREVVEQCVDSMLRNPDALLWLTQIKNKDEYTAEHSMNVCVLSANFARHLGLLELEIKEVALCGLLHDLGKTKIPVEILNKPGRLSDEENLLMKQHAKFGRDMLINKAKQNPIVVDVAYSHHEREDGSGYPRGLSSEQIPFFSKLVSLADTYDAITSNRCYDNSRSSLRALKILHECKGKLYDAELVTEFIRCIGIYPPGSIVEMNNGVVGIVVKSYPKNRLKPRLMIVTDENKVKRLIPKIVDLSSAQRSADDLAITMELTNGSFDIDLRDYLEQGLVLSSEKK